MHPPLTHKISANCAKGYHMETRRNEKKTLASEDGSQITDHVFSIFYFINGAFVIVWCVSLFYKYARFDVCE